MTAHRISGFSGVIPKQDPRNVADTAAQVATNVFLTSGRLDPMRAPIAISPVRSTIVKTIYRMFNTVTSTWLNWNEQVDIAESPVYVVNNSRIAFSSASFEPRQTDMTLASASLPYPTAWYVLGVTPPLSAPVFGSVVGGSGTTESRSYVYTFVTQWGEESAPSAPMSIQTNFISGTWNISLPDVTPVNSYSISAATHVSGIVTLTLNTVFGLRALEYLSFNGMTGMTGLNNLSFQVLSVNSTNNKITVSLPTSQTYISGGVATRDAPHNTTGMLKRVYRTNTNGGGTNYYQVGADLSATTTSFADNFTVIGGQIATVGWAMPPANLEGLVTHPSGSFVGFVGNQVYMSVPYSTYAWPVAQTNTIDYPVVGLGVFGQTVVVGTEGRPFTITFTDPAAATAQKVDENWPCLTKRGIVTYEGGVYFPTTLGLAYIGVSGAQLISKQFFAQRDWMALNPSSFVAAHYDNRYYAYYDDGISPRVLTFSGDTGISHIGVVPTAMYTDRKSGEIFIAQGGLIKQLNAPTGLYLEYDWKSKEFVSPNPINLGACKVDFVGAVTESDAALIEAANALITSANAVLLLSSLGSRGVINRSLQDAFAINGSDLADFNTPASNAFYVSISLYANGELVFVKEVANGKVWRFPAGLKYDNYSIGISGTAPIKAVVLGGTPLSLKEA